MQRAIIHSPEWTTGAMEGGDLGSSQQKVGQATDSKCALLSFPGGSGNGQGTCRSDRGDRFSRGESRGPAGSGYGGPAQAAYGGT
jgi:hypothetical protein